MRRFLILALILALIPLGAAGTPELSLKTGSGQVCPTESGEYAINIHNTGPASDKYTVTVESPWENSVTLSSSSVEVEAGETEKIYLWLQAPKDATPGERSFKTSVTSSNNGKTVSSSGDIRVLSCRSVSITPDQQSRTVCRGEEATYRMEVSNEGQVEETYRLSSDRGTLSTERVTLEPGETRSVTLTSSSQDETNRDISVEVESTSSYASDTTTLNFISEVCRSVEVSVAPEKASLCRSDTLTLTASVTNTGKVSDSYTLEIAGNHRNITLNPGVTLTSQEDIPARDIEGNLRTSVQSLSLQKVRDSTVTEAGVANCHDLSLEYEDAREEGERTLVELSLSNNGTKANTYNLQLDAPDWMDLRPQNVSLDPGDTRPVYLYMAPDFFGDGHYTASVVASGEGVRETLQMNVSSRNGTVSVDVSESRTPTGQFGRANPGLVSLVVTALILILGGYWFYRREAADIISPSQTRDYHKSADNYLDQNANTVVKSLRDDSLSDEFLEVLLEEEKQGKNRKRVLNQIRREKGDF